MKQRVITILAAVGLLALLGAAASTFITQNLIVQQTSNLAAATASTLTASTSVQAPTVIVGASATLTACNASPPSAAQPAGSLCVDASGKALYVSNGGGVWYSPGATNAYSFYGDGVSGACVLDGSTTCAGMVPAANVYTMSSDENFTALTVNVGVTLRTGGYVLHVQGALVDNGVIQNDGAGAAGANGGAGGAGNWLGGGTNGGNGAANSSTATGGGGGPHSTRDFVQGKANTGCNAPGQNGQTGQGGGGGDVSGGCAGDGGTVGWTTSIQPPTDILLLLQAHGIGDSAALNGGTGGGGGRGDGFTGTGGGGGGGGGWVVVAAKSVTGTGAIHSRGGAGGNGVAAPGSGGGGGAGGVVVVVTNSTSVSVTVDANAGARGTGAGGGVLGGNGGAGVTYVFHG